MKRPFLRVSSSCFYRQSAIWRRKLLGAPEGVDMPGGLGISDIMGAGLLVLESILKNILATISDIMELELLILASMIIYILLTIIAPTNFSVWVFGLGYYAPFYSYSNGYRARDYETFPSLRVYSGDYDSQRYHGNISRRLNCRDAWAGESPSNSLSSTIRSVFALQCENQPPVIGTDLPTTKDGLGAESHGKVDPPSELTSSPRLIPSATLGFMLRTAFSSPS